jgi:putative tricarboxylic transport membrane protein
MSSSPVPSGRPAIGGEALLSLGMVVLGAFVVWQGSLVTVAAGHSGVGPGLFPTLIGSGLSLIGLVLGWQALNGGWHGMPDDETAQQSADWRAFGLISLAVLLHMALIGWAGFIIASALLYALIARGFGSTRPARDIVIAAVLSVLVFFLFTRGLGLNLPAGWLTWGT